MSKRRTRVYAETAQKHGGYVPCFCCGRHVGVKQATLEHILPRSLGGRHGRENLAISHAKCNSSRGTHPSLVPAEPMLPKAKKR